MMTSTAKYSIGDTVYFMKNNKAVKAKVTGVQFPFYWKGFRGKLEQTSFTYTTTPKYKDIHFNTPECWLFSSKALLLKSL